MKLQHIALACLCTLLAAGVYLTIKSDMDAQLEEQKALNRQLVEQMRNLDRKMEEKTEVAAEAVPAAKPEVPKAVVAAAGPEEADRPGDGVPAEAVVPAASAAVTVPVEPGRGEIDPASEPGVTVRGGAAVNSVNAGAAPEALGAGLEGERERDILNTSLPETDRAALETADVPDAGFAAGKRLTKTQQVVLAQPAIARISQNKEDAGFVVIDRGKRANLVKGDAFAVRRGTAIIGRVVIGDTVEDEMAVADIKNVVTGMTFEIGDEIIKFDQQ
jgi:hypothetical protein